LMRLIRASSDSLSRALTYIDVAAEHLQRDMEKDPHFWLGTSVGSVLQKTQKWTALLKTMLALKPGFWILLVGGPLRSSPDEVCETDSVWSYTTNPGMYLP